MVSEKDIQNMSPEQIAELQKKNCIFCKIISGEVPSKIVHDDIDCIAILDINPANEGHMIIIPKEHYQIMPQVPEDVLGHMFVIAKKLSKALLMSTLGKSTSIFVANGATAGQKAPHFMIHIIPRNSESEFFMLPSKNASGQELEKLKNVIITKLGQIIGKSPLINSKFIDMQQPEDPIQTKTQQPITEEIIDKRKVATVGIKKEDGYLYFVDKQGDIARVPMARGKKKLLSPDYSKKEKYTEKITEEKRENNNKNLDDISKMLLGE